MEQEYQDLLSWYSTYCQRGPYFKYSFGFIDGLYNEFIKRQQTTKVLTYHIDSLFKDLEQLREQVNNLRNMIRSNLGHEPENESIHGLLGIKRQLVSWINLDTAQLYKHNIQHVDNKCVCVKDYCLQGETREKVAYNIYLNRRYLNKIYEYFIGCCEFNYLITHMPDGHQGILWNSSHDLTLVMAQDDWDGELHFPHNT